EIDVPTLVLSGRHDFFCPPSQAERLRRGIRASEAVIFEQSGHYPFVEEAEAFRQAVRGWLARAGWGNALAGVLRRPARRGGHAACSGYRCLCRRLSHAIIASRRAA